LHCSVLANDIYIIYGLPDNSFINSDNMAWIINTELEFYEKVVIVQLVVRSMYVFNLISYEKPKKNTEKLFSGF
jgi:hypothetical protein